MKVLKLPNAQAVFVHDDIDAISIAVAQRIYEIATLAMAARGVFHIALAGGETPRRCYQRLRDFDLDWQLIHVYFGDERCLPSGDNSRNDTMVRQTLLDHIVIPSANVHNIPAQFGARVATADYAALLSDVVLDLVLLGMGEDGHTASLFPGNPATVSTAVVVPVFNAPKPPAERVTLGINTLNAARQKIFLVAGAGKHDALEQILLGTALPAARVTAAEWHLDRSEIAGC